MYDVDGLDTNDKEVNSKKYTQVTDQKPLVSHTPIKVPPYGSEASFTNIKTNPFKTNVHSNHVTG